MQKCEALQHVELDPRLRKIVNEGGDTEPKSKTLGEVFPPKDAGDGDLKEALSKEAEERKKNARKVLEQLEKGSKEEKESSSESHSRYGLAIK